MVFAVIIKRAAGVPFPEEAGIGFLISNGDKELYSSMEALLSYLTSEYDRGSDIASLELWTETAEGKYIFTDISYQCYGDEKVYYYLSADGLLLSGAEAPEDAA